MDESEIDLRMRGLVFALNALGVPTSGSCEGHVDHGSPAPWIKVGGASKGVRRKIERLLDEFYKNRNVSEDARLITQGGKSGFWIHNGGKDYDRWRAFIDECVIKIDAGKKVRNYFDAEERSRRSEKLVTYQKEAGLFTEFLKKMIE